MFHHALSISLCSVFSGWLYFYPVIFFGSINRRGLENSLLANRSIRSHVRFETARNVLAENLGHYGLRVKDWTTTAGGESNEARVDQILSYVTALDLETWAVVDDEAP